MSNKRDRLRKGPLTPGNVQQEQDEDVLFSSGSGAADVWGDMPDTPARDFTDEVYGAPRTATSGPEGRNTDAAIIKHGDGTLQAGKVMLSEIGIANIGDLSDADLSIFGELLFQMDSSIQWWLGDWLNRVPQAWGATIESVAERTGKEAKTLYEYQQVSRKIEIAVRSAKLTWTHHRTIAMSVPEDQYIRWIKWAENGNEQRHSVRDLKTAIKQALTGPSENPDFDAVTSRWATEVERINLIQDAIEGGDAAAAREQIRILRAWLSDLSKVL